MERVMILATPAEIAEGLRMFLAEYVKEKPEPSFHDDKMTVSAGSIFIDVSYSTLCNWINEGKVPIHGKGRTRFLLKSELIAALK